MNNKGLMLGEMSLSKTKDGNMMFYIDRMYNINYKEISKMVISKKHNDEVLLDIEVNNKTIPLIDLKDILKITFSSWNPVSGICETSNYKTFLSTVKDLVVKVYVKTELEHYEYFGFRLSIDNMPIDVLVVESTINTDQKVSFTNIEKEIKDYVLKKYRHVAKICRNEDLLTVVSNETKEKLEEMFKTSRYKIVLEDIGLSWRSGSIEIHSARLVIDNIDRVISEINVSSCGIDLAIFSLMETYKYMYIADEMFKILNNKR